MSNHETKYIFITGGVLSSLGKGIAAASISTLLKNVGFKVSILKADPYINVDPGTMSPLEHGEVFVTDDGAETDLDLGHYERFLDENLTQANNFTTGRVYSAVIEKSVEAIIWERRFRLFPISSMKSPTVSKRRVKAKTFSSSRSAVRSATSRVCRF